MCIETAWMLCWETQAWLYRRWQITGILISLRCTNDAGFCFAFFKNKLKVCSNPALISTIFPTAFVLLVSVTFWWLSRWKGKWKSLSRVRLYGPWNSQARILEWVAFPSRGGIQGIFPTQGSNPGLLHCRQILYQLSHKESPRILDSHYWKLFHYHICYSDLWSVILVATTTCWRLWWWLAFSNVFFFFNMPWY